MKKIIAIVAAVLMLGITTGCNQRNNTNEGIDRQTVDSISRLLGQLNGAQLKMMVENDNTIDLKQMLAGIQTGFAVDTVRSFKEGANIGMRMQDMMENIKERFGVELDPRVFMLELKKTATDTATVDRAAMQELNTQLDRIMNNVQKQKSRKNIDAGKKYVDDQLAADPSFKKTSSGLVYKVIAEGEGANFTEADSININYEGKKVDGTVFDKGTQKFTMRNVVPGFAEALKMMKPGSKLEVILPYDLAYGEEGNRNMMTGQLVIEPYETLIFTMEAVK